MNEATKHERVEAVLRRLWEAVTAQLDGRGRTLMGYYAAIAAMRETGAEELGQVVLTAEEVLAS